MVWKTYQIERAGTGDLADVDKTAMMDFRADFSSRAEIPGELQCFSGL